MCPSARLEFAIWDLLGFGIWNLESEITPPFSIAPNVSAGPVQARFSASAFYFRNFLNPSPAPPIPSAQGKLETFNSNRESVDAHK
jgi:hypothetical protein